MTQKYIVLSVIAFLSYSLVAPLLKIAMETIPTTTAVFMSNFVMFVLLAGILRYNKQSVSEYLIHEKSPYILCWGVVLAVGVLAYYQALSLGPVSVVVPIYGLFIAVSSVIGVVALDEEHSWNKVASIVLAILAIYLMSV